MKNRVTISYFILLLISITLVSADMSFPKVDESTSWDIISEVLICVQPVIWISFVQFDLRKDYFNKLIMFGLILFYTGSFQNVMDEIYKLEGAMSQLDKILMPTGMMIISIVVILSFINERKVNSRISEKSVKDSLTGLYNRHYLEEKLESILNEAVKFNYEVSVAFIDIDNFKRINDTEGHKKGDELLEYIGKFINNCIRNTDYAFRYGGDEFLIVYQNTAAEVALKVTDRIKDKLKKNVLFHKNKISMSSGIASYQRTENWKELINRADQAMYKSKINGKDRTTVASVSF